MWFSVSFIVACFDADDLIAERRTGADLAPARVCYRVRPQGEPQQFLCSGIAGQRLSASSSDSLGENGGSFGVE
jgi:hypothetical protein